VRTILEWVNLVLSGPKISNIQESESKAQTSPILSMRPIPARLQNIQDKPGCDAVIRRKDAS